MNTCKLITMLFCSISLLGCFDIPAPPPPPIVGTWNAKISVKDSNCRKIQRGNVYSEQWNINYINRKITVRSTGSSTNIRAYEGAYSGYGDKVFLSSVGSSSDKMKMDLVQENDFTFRGEGRIETRGSCYAYCIIELTK